MENKKGTPGQVAVPSLCFLFIEKVHYVLRSSQTTIPLPSGVSDGGGDLHPSTSVGIRVACAAMLVP
jgi:hypothetical protein